MSDEVRPASIPSAPLYYLYVLCWIDALGLVRRGDALRRINFFSIFFFLCCERKTFQRLSLLLSFVFSFGKLSSVPWEWWLLRARYRRVDLGAAKRSVVHYVTPAALHANSISGCRLGTFRVSLFSFFLFIDRIFRLSLYFLLGIASSSFIRERAFLGGVSYIPEIVEKFKWRGGPFLKQKWKDPVRQFLSPPCIFPLCWTRLMSFHLSEMASSAPTRNPRLFTTRHHHHHRLLLLVF